MKFRLLLPAIGMLLLPLQVAKADPIDRIVERQMRQSSIPGSAVAVVEDGKVVKLRGYGTAAVEWNARVTPETPFQLASGTKIFTGVLLMRLVERGEVRLDDSISRFFDGAPPTWQSITVRHLIHYTSGLPFIPGAAGGKTGAEVIAEAMKAPLAYPTGSDSQYILTNMIVLKAILEKATGTSYEALLDREIVKPLGLKSTRYNQMVDQPGNMRVSEPVPGRAVVYSRDGQRLIVREAAYNPASYAAGGLFSSVADLARLFVAIDSGTFLSKESVAALITPAVLSSGRPGGWAVGWTVRSYRGNTLVGHSGGPALSDVVRLPDRKLTVIVLTNTHYFYPLLAEAILDTYLPARPPRVTLADPAPDLTAKLMAALSSAEKGKLDTASFAEKARGQAASYWDGFGQGYLAAMGMAHDARLVREEKRGVMLIRTYAVRFSEREGFLEMSINPAGEIAGLYPVSER
ncbi:beta-lactamase family protein [Sphingomonas suaedae]|uniref:Beta-lactamase family protein n=1 Tax=Sphingomonas suaedae TaxID=2599297 RepID=A0A518RBF6_9SPHN|nr:serine hydrolase domain-containing protein [Sphingomonas suaedae]QDX24805.1 beta-lactamase family protein [Sphingomonas suaedae]